MVTHLYKNFITNEKVYIQNIEFWKSLIYTLLSVEKLNFKEYLTTTKPDGSLYMDGNPIYNFKIENSNRAVRIIQETPQCNDVEFSAWINSTELSDNSKIDELVISIELSNETALMSIELINAWIVNKFPKQKMEKFIDKLFTIKENLFKFENLHDKELIYA
jgi:hypothetical protein